MKRSGLGQIKDTISIRQRPADVEDRATEREEDEVLEGLGTAGLKEIEMIEAALARIKDSVYGECTKCGEAISGQRLDLLPYTPLCRNCA